jgi:hypothetical protein
MAGFVQGAGGPDPHRISSRPQLPVGTARGPGIRRKPDGRHGPSAAGGTTSTGRLVERPRPPLDSQRVGGVAGSPSGPSTTRTIGGMPADASAGDGQAGGPAEPPAGQPRDHPQPALGGERDGRGHRPTGGSPLGHFPSAPRSRIATRDSGPRVPPASRVASPRNDRAFERGAAAGARRTLRSRPAPGFRRAMRPPEKSRSDGWKKNRGTEQPQPAIRAPVRVPVRGSRRGTPDGAGGGVARFGA